MKIQYTLQFVQNLIEIEILPTCVSRCVTRLRKKFRSKFLVIVRKKKRKKQLAAFTKQRLRLDRKLHREIEDERRRCQLATSYELLQPWRNIHHPFRIHLHVSWRYARPPRIPQNPLEAVNLSAGRPIPVDIPDFINSSFAGLHSAY